MQYETKLQKNNDFHNEKEQERFESIISFSDFVLQVNRIISPKNNMDLEVDNEQSLDDKRFLELLASNFDSSQSSKNFLYNLLKFRCLFDKYIIKREYAKNHKQEGQWSLQQVEKYKEAEGKGRM